MRYTFNIVEAELRWPSDIKLEWSSWLTGLQKSEESLVQYDADSCKGLFSTKTLSGTLGPNWISVNIHLENGARRALFKALRQFLHSTIEAAPDARPLVSVEINGYAQIPKAWEGPVRPALEAAKLSPWVVESAIVDYVGVKYYLRHEHSKTLAVLEVTPGFVNETRLQFDLEVFYGNATAEAVKDIEAVTQRIFEADLPRLVGKKEND